MALRQNDRKLGFTLLELIVVITVIGIMSTFVVIQVGGFSGKAKQTKAQADVKTIFDAATMYYTQVGRYPDSIAELVNARDDSGQPITGSLREYPMDPWGREYYYEIGPDGPIVICYGRDGSEGGEGEDADQSQGLATQGPY